MIPSDLTFEPFLAESTHPLLIAVVGLALLVAGRKIFWLAVGVTGFAFGLGLAIRFLDLESPWVHLVIALLAGVLGIALAFLVQRLAVALAGFILGGYGGLWLWQMLDAPPWELPSWLVFLVAGMVVALLASGLFELALIGLSAWLGAALLVDAAGVLGLLDLRGAAAAVATLALAALGAWIQTGVFRRR
ncbi:MAG: DUF4203 domain-containing protein [Acidobacteriota bacterium]